MNLSELLDMDIDVVDGNEREYSQRVWGQDEQVCLEARRRGGGETCNDSHSRDTHTPATILPFDIPLASPLAPCSPPTQGTDAGYTSPRVDQHDHYTPSRRRHLASRHSTDSEDTTQRAPHDLTTFVHPPSHSHRSLFDGSVNSGDADQASASGRQQSRSSTRRSSLRPVPISIRQAQNIGPVSSTSGTLTTPRPSPYRIPLPLSSARSTMSLSNNSSDVEVKLERELPLTPPRRRSALHEETTPTKRSIASPPVSMSSSRRRAPPAWPTTRTQGDGETHHQSHRERIARSAGIPAGQHGYGYVPIYRPIYGPRPPGYVHTPTAQTPHSHPQPLPQSHQSHAQTPTALKVPPTAMYSPAFHRQGYAHYRPHPYYLAPASPYSPYQYRPTHPNVPPLTPGQYPAGSAGRLQSSHPPGPAYSHPYLRSAPAQSVARLPNQPTPPSPTKLGTPVMIKQTRQGGVQMQNVSQAWVIKGLNQNAPNVWFKPETTDCRVIVPIWSTLEARITAREEAAKAAEAGVTLSAPAVHNDKLSAPDGSSDPPSSARSTHSNQPGRSFWPPTPVGPAQIPMKMESGLAVNEEKDGDEADGKDAEGEAISKGKGDVVSAHTVQRGRRGSLPERDQIPVLVFPLHRDYLITQSKLFRLLLSSTQAQFDLPVPPGPSRAGGPALRTTVLDGDPYPSQPLDEKMLQGAKILPTPEGDPVACFLPMPDPAAFGIIIHWMYWGDAGAVENALSTGLVEWQGLVHDIDYLEVDDGLKRIVGKWWRKWIKTEAQADGRSRRSEPSQAWFDEDDEEEEHATGKKVGRRGGNEGGSGDEAEDEDENKEMVVELDEERVGVKKQMEEELGGRLTRAL